MNNVIAYAGIGSRKVELAELQLIRDLARMLAERSFVCYTGGAEGSDHAFLTGSNGQAIIMLPWADFSYQMLMGVPRINQFDCGNTEVGNALTTKYHPRSPHLNRGPRALMNRNAHQVLGIAEWPQVKFVVCCARPTPGKPGEVDGGTGHAVRIANDLKIPVINLREPDWMGRLVQVVYQIDNPQKEPS